MFDKDISISIHAIERYLKRVMKAHRYDWNTCSNGKVCTIMKKELRMSNFRRKIEFDNQVWLYTKNRLEFRFEKRFNEVDGHVFYKLITVVKYKQKLHNDVGIERLETGEIRIVSITRAIESRLEDKQIWEEQNKCV